MTADSNLPGGWLGRWSRVKREAAREKAAATEVPGTETRTPPAATPEQAGMPAAAPASAVREHSQSLPPVESLTIDSDFSAFLDPRVDETLKRQALRQLFRDPHFNVMDGLDTYIDDYSKPDPIDPDVVRQMVQGRYIFDPPQTRVTAQGFVEDVPPEEAVPPQAVAPAEALPGNPISEGEATTSIPAVQQGELLPVPTAAAGDDDIDAASSRPGPPVDPPASPR
jgi:hypothetical protein